MGSPGGRSGVHRFRHKERPACLALGVESLNERNQHIQDTQSLSISLFGTFYVAFGGKLDALLALSFDLAMNRLYGLCAFYAGIKRILFAAFSPV